jgi:tRNA modification GTPase
MHVIHALSSGLPPSGVAVIRISGDGAFEVARHLIDDGQLPPPRRAALRRLVRPQDGQMLDEALVITFPGPRSFTGEDTVELHCHGSVAVVAGVQAALGELGARAAEPGEFTRRAFESGRLDLTQAEALSDLIAAETDSQRDQALAQAGGKLRTLAEGWRAQLVAIAAELEAGLDFSDEADVADALEASGRSSAALDQLAIRIAAALATAPMAERVRNGLTIAITGPPNAGKSSLFNALVGRDAAIVTPVPGTTRDVIEVHLDLGGRAAVLLDTAGIRETDDLVEAEGIARARARAASADLVLDLGPGGNVVNRIDQTGETAGLRGGRLYVSARSGAGLDALEQWLIDWATHQIPAGEPSVVTTARQRELVQSAYDSVREAAAQADPVLAAEGVRAAAIALGRLTGHIDAEEILGAIFSRFCIGK